MNSQKRLFTEKPVSNKSAGQRRLVYGVGVNDSVYITDYLEGGERLKCPFYARWCSVLQRCYSSTIKGRHPSYEGCYMSDDWLTFSNFKEWMENQDWVGKHLDKDILVQGNKLYSKDTCIFVSPRINLLLTSSDASRGSYPQGVSAIKNRFKASVSDNGESVFLGSFLTAEEASRAYVKRKIEIISKIALTQKEPLKSALLNYKLESIKEKGNG